MPTLYQRNMHIEGRDLAADPLDPGTYEACTFERCSFVGASLEACVFIDCAFSQCDFTRAYISETSFREVHFLDCKLIGLPFDTCPPFLLQMAFTRCRLDYAAFAGMDLRKWRCEDSHLIGVDFTGTNLSQASLQGCDLRETIFDRTNLEKANLSGVENLLLDPTQNRIKGATFSLEALPGLLQAYQIRISRH